MPRARPAFEARQTAAVLEDQGGGCLSGFALVPIAVFLISAMLGVFAWTADQPTGSIHPYSSDVISVENDQTKISPIFRPEVQFWSQAVVDWSSVYQLDPNLAATIMQIESCGDPRAVSSAGAMGLFQVMPFHFSAADDPFDPNINAARGLAYLRRSLEAGSGNVRLAMAGYNGGIGVIGRGEWTWSAQTRRYVEYGYPIYLDAINGNPSSESLENWYTRYGASLCRQAAARLGLK